VVVFAGVPVERAPFEDVTVASRIDFQHRASRTSRKYLIESMTGGVAMIDYDGDGRLDLYFVNGAKLKDPMKAGALPVKTDERYWNRLHRNQGDGTSLRLSGAVKRDVDIDIRIVRPFLRTTGALRSSFREPQSLSVSRGVPSRRFQFGFPLRVLRVRPDVGGPPQCHSRPQSRTSKSQARNAILLGGPRSNLWTKLFEERLTYRFDFTGKRSVGRLANTRPRPGEPAFNGAPQQCRDKSLRAHRPGSRPR